ISQLHTAAVSSVQSELQQWKTHAQRLQTEKDALETRLQRQQVKHLFFAETDDDRFEQQSSRYEERITELHSVIAELRKKNEQKTICVIREEDEFEDSDDGNVSKSGDAFSANENHPNDSPSTYGWNLIDFLISADLGNDFNAELSRVVTQLEKSRLENQITQSTDEKPAMVKETLISGSQCNVNLQVAEPNALVVRLSQLEEERDSLEEHCRQQDIEAERFKLQLSNVREERDRLKRKVRELQTRAQSLEASSSMSPSISPVKQACMSPTPQGYERHASILHGPVPRRAEMRKLRTGGKVLGAEISSSGLSMAKVAEHLSQSFQECSNVQELIQTASQEGNVLSDGKINTFEIELERLQSKIDNLKSQNDLLTLTLEESKGHCDRLTVLIGKYESNNTALQLVLGCSDQAIEAYQALMQLLETDQAVLLANCRAAGLGAMEESSEQFQQDVTLLLQNAHLKRKSAEHHAKLVLQRREVGRQHCGSPWEELSSSRTASTTSSTGSDTEFTKQDEVRLRELIHSLCSERQAVKMTTLELESVHVDPLGYEATPPNPEAQRLDLENAVLMQELMAMKEDKAELKAQNFLLEKERRSFELQLRGKESQEKVYQVQIDHLKSQMDENQQRLGIKDPKKDDGYDSATPAITLAELRSNNASQIAEDLSESLKRERRLKGRVQELVATLEKLSKNSEIRHQQSAEFVNDLKKANSALVTAFEKAKKKYLSKVKKLEVQLKTSTERYEAHICALNQRVSHLEEESIQLRHEMSETSL
ncbi:hypothetical protein CAPTEDRAFT_145778, partial [Capitella teleta]|uniref:Harmonin-binding protein USHBP1 PDZ-binding domain-containing protein n=1 Tax=Capitella teleta TaxID=283909 RepID=X1Z4D3_CAPTE